MTIPTLLIFALAIGAIPPNPGELNVIVGGVIYPEPPLVIVIIPTIPFPIVAVAVAPFPPPSKKRSEGATVYPYPGFVISSP